MGSVADPFSVEIQVPDVEDESYIVIVQNSETGEHDITTISVK